MTTSNETDIVNRLRDNAEVCFCTISRDAADEIERLRAEIERLRSLHYYTDDPALAPDPAADEDYDNHLLRQRESLG